MTEKEQVIDRLLSWRKEVASGRELFKNIAPKTVAKLEKEIELRWPGELEKISINEKASYDSE